MTRLSTNPVTIRTQIEQSAAVQAEFETQLETVPKEDTHERESLDREIRMEKGRRAKLDRHLLGLECEYDDLLEGTLGTHDQYEEQ